MRSVRVFALTVLAPLLAAAAPGDNAFDLKVTRVRTLRDQPGDLHIDSQGIAFRSGDGKTHIAIAMPDIREASVADVRAPRFETYEVRKWKPMERRAYTFRAQSDAPVENLARFLAGLVHRPAVGHYKEGSQFRVAAFHRRALKGTDGTLEICEESIQFVSAKPADSRTWACWAARIGKLTS